ncbi:hypothetical protein V0M98_38400 (plasmid) [Pseudomonas silesiensis]|uniref:hypothetical protein n=1 Tax=Pseudomonas silesiensis TaxID=1853130 RepID=UPI0030CA97DA
MSTSLELDFGKYDLVIEDPSDQKSWVKAFEPLMPGWAQENYGLKHEAREYDFDEKTSKSLGECIAKAMQKYRKEVAESIVNDEPFTEWEHVLGDAANRELHGEFGSDHDVNDHFLYGKTFKKLSDCIEKAMEEHDGPVCDLEELVDEIRMQTRYKMEELDTSTIYDEVGKLSVTLMYVPGFDPNVKSADSFDINPSEISTQKPGLGHQALLNLVRVSIPDLMELVEVDQDDSELIDAWLELEDPVAKAQALGQPVTPVFSSSEDLKSLFDNTDGCSYVLPCWVGSLTFNELRKIDPTQPYELSGGIISFTENNNGAGYYLYLDESEKIVVHPSDFLGGEHGRTVGEIYDVSLRDLEAKIAIHAPSIPEIKVPASSVEELSFS